MNSFLSSRRFKRDGSFEKPVFSFYEPIKDVENLDKIRDFLQRNGLDLNSYKEKYMIRRIRGRMMRTRKKTYAEYYNLLVSSKTELDNLKDSLSINVTRFFRNRDTWDYLENVMFPAVFRHHPRNKPFKIWVAGNSLGAEAYTYAIILERLNSKMNRTIRYEILATDINEENLLFAQKGIYPSDMLTELNEYEKRNYFVETIDNEFRVSPMLRRNITYKKHDLVRDPFPRGFDWISCRNVLIYISKEQQIHLFEEFSKSLNPNGVLVLGRTESLPIDFRSNLKVVSPIHRIYQKSNQVRPRVSLTQENDTPKKYLSKTRPPSFQDLNTRLGKIREKSRSVKSKRSSTKDSSPKKRKRYRWGNL